MQLNRRLLAMSAVLVITAIWPDPVRAADAPSIDVAGGYAFSRITNEDGTNFPTGWFASIGGNFTPMFGIVGEVSGAYKTDSSGGTGGTLDMKFRQHTFMAGPKVMSGPGRAKVFGQLLFGGATLGTSITSSQTGLPSMSSSGSQTYFAVAPGGGVDIKISGNVGIRLGANFQLVKSPSTWATAGKDNWAKWLQAVVGIEWSSK